MELFYENSIGKRVDFTKVPFLIQNPEDLFSYEWKYETSKNYSATGNITKFSKSVSSKTMDIAIWADSNKEYNKSLNLLNQIAEVDVLNLVPGKLYCDKYYLSCYLYTGKYSEYEEEFYTTNKKINVLTDIPFWIKETQYSFEAKALFLSNVKKYAYKYPYRYSISAGENSIENNHYADCNFKLRIYGPCVNPHIIIGTHRYQVWTILTAGEWLEIDSIRNKVYKVMVNGTKVSLFNERDKLSSVFDKIPPGRQRVAAPGTFNFDLILYEERSEPEWS